MIAMRQFMLDFVGYACTQKAEYAAGYANFSPLTWTDFGVLTYLARLATPHADWAPYPGCEATQRLN